MVWTYGWLCGVINFCVEYLIFVWISGWRREVDGGIE